MAVSVEISTTTFVRIDRLLSSLSMVSRLPVIKRGMRVAGDVIKKRAKEIVPQPGYPGDKPGLKALRDTVAVRVNDYHNNNVIVATVGYAYPAGAHGHLVEEGHRIAVGGTLKPPRRKTAAPSKLTGKRGKGTVAGYVAGTRYLQAAADATRDATNTAFQEAVEAAVTEATRGD